MGGGGRSTRGRQNARPRTHRPEDRNHDILFGRVPGPEYGTIVLTMKAVRRSARAAGRAFTSACVVFVVLAGCGARTGLPGEEFRADASTERDASIDMDAFVTFDASVECVEDRDCVDSVMCTDEVCAAGVCLRRTFDERCEASECEIAACDAEAGCVSTPRRCDDGVECTVDDCADESGCVHEPDDARCPVSTRCDPSSGCTAIAWVHDDDGIYQVDLPDGDVTLLGSVPLPSWTDIALASDRTLYGVSSSGLLYRIADDFDEVEPLRTLPSDTVALEVGPDGGLYSAGVSSGVFRTDLETGAVALIGELPSRWATSGDIAFVGDRLLITVTDEPLETTGRVALAAFDDGEFRIVGPSEASCLWGIAAFGEDVYGFSCRGWVYRIDARTGSAEFIRDIGVAMRGAAAR